ncbi:MAG TPA: hypothetical protein VFW87_25280 [Pirellulales bacterium]|nr:hypothetical protein [Pirellulales bacterium]
MTRHQFFGVTEHSKAAKHRLDDARALLKEQRWRRAMYLGGYAIECLLMAKLMKMYHCRQLSDLENVLQARGALSANATIFTHQLEILIGLTQRLGQLWQHADHWRSFTLVNRWVPAWRYSADLSNRDDADRFLCAVATVSQWIENNV